MKTKYFQIYLINATTRTSQTFFKVILYKACKPL